MHVFRKCSFSEDRATEINTVQQNSDNDNTQTSLNESAESETLSSSIFSKCGNVTTLKSEQVNISDSSIELTGRNTSSTDAEITELQREESNLNYSDDKTSINFNSSNEIRFDEVRN